MDPKAAQLKQEVLRLLGAPKYRPLDKIELAKLLGRKSGVRMGLNEILRELEHAGEIARIRKNRYVLPSEADLVTGAISIHQAGYGFVSQENKPGAQDLFISTENTGTAMHGDRVVARVTRDEKYSRAKGSDRAEGRVIRILQRAHETIVGTLQQSPNFFYVVPDDPRIPHNVYVQPGKARTGDKVVVRLDAWESRHVNPEGEIVEVLGPSSAPGVDMLSIVRKYHLPTEFPPAVLAEAERIPEIVDPKMFAGREDLRKQFIVTIDPDDARDFDDAINVERLTNGWQLGVHIADVSAYVTPGSQLDREALKRGNSVYLPDRVIPMLPERLSNGVCSLNPNVDRLTHSAFIEFEKNGRARNVRFGKTVIRSAKRLTYRQAYAILKSPPTDQLSERLHVAWELAALLRRKRFEHGSLDLDFPEVKVRLDADGKPIALERIENDESHQLIEEFMLAANEMVARELKNRLIPTVYRVHENPDPDKLTEYREQVLSYGYKAGDLTQRVELQRLLKSFSGKPEEQALKIGLLKSLKRARYTTQPLGHYGLSKNNYTHFTSPIRRYADLVVHRSLAEQNKARIEVGRLTSVAEHISTTERNAAEAEMDAVKLKKLEFFQRQLDARDPQIFRASVIDIKNFGLLVELPDVLLTGMIHISSLTDDFYRFDQAQRRLIGRQSRRRFSIGDQLRVFVARVDVFKRQVDFAIAEEKTSERRGRRSR
ncbi:MAG: ribonuclease R [Verrucomicrobiota bacterium]|nr:ribonuclease R [Verrucomicrobiota bacterium]MDQ6938837.1 ribonuclease R [Verrucomicrobiota bacterium]